MRHVDATDDYVYSQQRGRTVSNLLRQQVKHVSIEHAHFRPALTRRRAAGAVPLRRDPSPEWLSSLPACQAAEDGDGGDSGSGGVPTLIPGLVPLNSYAPTLVLAHLLRAYIKAGGALESTLVVCNAKSQGVAPPAKARRTAALHLRLCTAQPLFRPRQGAPNGCGANNYILICICGIHIVSNRYSLYILMERERGYSDDNSKRHGMRTRQVSSR